MLPRQDQPPLGVGESASVPSAAAIANAIFDATGVRFREPPFTRERILAGLQGEARATPPRCRWRQPAAADGFRPVAGSVRQTAGRAGNGRGRVYRGGRHRGGGAAMAVDRADRAAGCVGLFGRDPRPRPAACRARRLRGLPHRSQWRHCSTPADVPSRRRSARSTAPTSRPIPRPALAPGRIPPSSAPCARASIATAGISIRPFPIRILPGRPTPTCRRSTRI